MMGRFRMASAALWPCSAEKLFIISRLSRSAERSKRIFTGGVVKGNGSCSAAFCESAALGERLLLSASGLNPLRLCFANPPPPKGEVLLYLPEVAEKLPLRGSWHRAAMTERVQPAEILQKNFPRSTALS